MCQVNKNKNNTDNDFCASLLLVFMLLKYSVFVRVLIVLDVSVILQQYIKQYSNKEETNFPLIQSATHEISDCREDGIIVCL